MVWEAIILSVGWVSGCVVLRPVLIKMAAFERYERRRIQAVLADVERKFYETLDYERKRRMDLQNQLFQLKRVGTGTELRRIISDIEETIKAPLSDP